MLDIDPFPFLAALATDDTLFVVVYSALLPVIGMDLTEMGVIRPVLAASKNGTEHGRATVIRPANGDHTHYLVLLNRSIGDRVLTSSS